jgi:hypothetical protein
MTHHDHIPDLLKMIIGTVTSVTLFFYNKVIAVQVPPVLHDFNQWAEEISPILSCVAALLTIALGVRTLISRKKKK